MAYVVRTPENVTFEFELAGLGSRALAWAVDVLVMIALIVVASQLVSAVGPYLGGFANAVFFVIVFLVQWGYGAVLEWRWGGRTVGKRALGLRALSADGTRLTFIQAVIRNLVRVVDLLPGIYLVGGVTALIDPNRRRLGDLAASTIVVKERGTPAPSAVVPETERHNRFLDDPEIALAVRRITPPEREAMVGLSLRRERLALSVRRSLFKELSDHLETRLGLSRPSYLSEEKFVLNLTAAALRSPSKQRP